MTNSQKILLFAFLLASAVGQAIANGNARMSRSLYEAQGLTATESDHDAKKKQSGQLLLEQAIPRPESLGEKQLVVRGAQEATNVALGKYTQQSSTDVRSAYNGKSSRAVDGNTSGVWVNGDDLTITITNKEENPWWEVHLGAEYTISSLKVFNRDTAADRLSGFKVEIYDADDSLTWEHTNPSGTPDQETDITVVPKAVIGSKVRVSLEGSDRILSLAEVEVYGVPTNAPKEGEWFIYNAGDATENPISANDILIMLPFNTSNRERDAKVYESDCVTELNITSAAYAVTTTEPTSTEGDGFIQFNTSLTVDINEFNGTKYMKPFEDDTRGGYIEVCLETFLKIVDRDDLGNDDVNQKVNFRNIILNISVSLNSDFEVDDVKVDRKEVDTENVETDYSEFVTAFLCNPADQTKIDSPVPYNQGDPITVCAKDESTPNLVQVEEFNELVVSQEGNTPYNFIKNALYNPEITTPACVGGASSGPRRVCYVKFVALPRFFAEADPKDLIISGSVFVVRDGTSVRRSLRMALPAPKENNAEHALAVSGRRAQAEGEEGSGDFEVTASLGSTTADSAAPGLTAAVAGLVSVAVGAAGEALMA